MENNQTSIQKLLANQFVRYAIIGGINTGVSFIIFKSLLFLFGDEAIRKSISFVIAQFCGIVISYLLNSTLTFKRKLSLKGFIAFAGPLVGLQFIISGGGMYVLSSLGVNDNIAFIILTGINVVLGYLLTKISLSLFAEKAE